MTTEGKAEYYHTIATPTEGFYKEKGSKFIAHAYPVRNLEEVKSAIDTLRKRYHDARHHCYAYLLGAEGKEFRANDDGEPNHSAGDPILGQIRAFGLTQVLVVVVRYFGGTKLGVGGLIHAYRTASEAALSEAQVVKVDISIQLHLHFDYEATNEVMRCIKAYDLAIVEQQYEADCHLIVAVKLGQETEVKAKIQLLMDTGHHVSFRTEKEDKDDAAS